MMIIIKFIAFTWAYLVSHSSEKYSEFCSFIFLVEQTNKIKAVNYSIKSFTFILLYGYLSFFDYLSQKRVYLIQIRIPFH